MSQSHRFFLAVAVGAWCSSACSCMESRAASQQRGAPPPVVSVPVPSAPVASAQRPAEAETAAPAETPEEPRKPRVYAKTRHVWIRAQPDSSLQWIGYLWLGGSVALRSPDPVSGPGCKKWYAIEPRGYVCVDGERATLDLDDAEYKSILPVSPKVDEPSPHRYAESLGAERFMRLPTVEEQKRREARYEPRMEQIARARAGGEIHPALQGVDFSPGTDDPFDPPSLPKTLQIPRTYLKQRSTVAYTRQVEHLGRTFLLTADLAWLPKDRTVPYPVVEFSGVHLSGDDKLPLAFFRKSGRPRYRRTAAGEFVADGTFERHGHVFLTGESEKVDDVVYLQTRRREIYVAKDDAILPTPSERTPWGAETGKPDTTKHRPRGRQTWIEASVWGRWLIAYEGTRPVFTTMISPGRGGTPVEGKDPIETASTPTGRFNITGKFVTATMVAPNDLVHSDVPWTQNFSGPHALHGAYWHDDWGDFKSGGCINVSPIDGKWLYEFTEPAVPKDWHAVRWDPKNEASTTLIVHR